MYPSDYGYATSGDSSMNRISCLNKSLNREWYEASSCYNNDWLYNSSIDQWTLTPFASDFSDSSTGDSAAANVEVVMTIGVVGTANARFDNEVLPSVYLKSSVAIVNGNGSKESPYELLGD